MPGVHLHEVEVEVLVEEELHRARVDVVRPPWPGGPRPPPCAARSSSETTGAGRLLDQLLVAALHRAVALAEVHRRCRGCRDDLDLDVARALDELLEVDGAVLEGGRRLGLARAVAVLQERELVVGDAHAASTATGHRLDHHRVADLLGDRAGLLDSLVDDAVGAGHDGHVRGQGDLTRLRLVAHHRDGLGRGTDEADLAAAADLGEAGVLGEEAVARMDRVDVGDLRRGDDAGDVEVRLGARAGDRCRWSRRRSAGGARPRPPRSRRRRSRRPASRAARMMRSAISPRFATRMRVNIRELRRLDRGARAAAGRSPRRARRQTASGGAPSAAAPLGHPLIRGG